jgi:predicted N-acyltransferase
MVVLFVEFHIINKGFENFVAYIKIHSNNRKSISVTKK